jgi:hypothetical protein
MHGQPIIKRTRGSILGKGKQFSPLRNVQTGSGAKTASFSVGTGDAFPPKLKRPQREAHYSHPFGAEAENEWNYTFTPSCGLYNMLKDLNTVLVKGVVFTFEVWFPA